MARKPYHAENLPAFQPQVREERLTSGKPSRARTICPRRTRTRCPTLPPHRTRRDDSATSATARENVVDHRARVAWARGHDEGARERGRGIHSPPLSPSPLAVVVPRPAPSPPHRIPSPPRPPHPGGAARARGWCARVERRGIPVPLVPLASQRFRRIPVPVHPTQSQRLLGCAVPGMGREPRCVGTPVGAVAGPSVATALGGGGGEAVARGAEPPCSRPQLPLLY